MSIKSFWTPSKGRCAAGPDVDVEALVARMRSRLYPETMPVLGSYWLKTVYAKGQKHAWWGKLNGCLKTAIREERLNGYAREVLVQVQGWIEQTVLRNRKTPAAPQVPPRLYRANLPRERLHGYVRRLLNQWMPAEVAYLLTDEGSPEMQADDGIPVQVIAKAIERLLVRDRLSPATLEVLLHPELFSPHDIYPADVEILRDVVLALLGQTGAPASSILPATILTLAPGTPLPADYAKAVHDAFLIDGERNQQVHVPIAAVQALEMLKCDSMRIASTIVTMDGRWWESENLETGEQNAVEYKPAGRLRIDFSSDHAKLGLPLPYTRLRWSGAVQLQDRYEVFGREWHVVSWERDADRTWANLVFSQLLPIEEIPVSDTSYFRRSHPALVDMAWSAMADALASSLARNDREPIEQLRRSELVPLGRAIYGFAESVAQGRLRQPETVETQLRSIRYLEAEVSPVYGRVPWGVLPSSIQRALFKSRHEAGVLELLDQAFDEVPRVLVETARKGPQSGESTPSTFPRQAA